MLPLISLLALWALHFVVYLTGHAPSAVVAGEQSMRNRVVTSLLVLLGITGLLFAQRADRATITEVVSDPSGNNVPQATVKIRNDDTGVENAFTTNDAGAYTSPLLVLGNYTVTVEMQGFKTSIRPGIQ